MKLSELKKDEIYFVVYGDWDSFGKFLYKKDDEYWFWWYDVQYKYLLFRKEITFIKKATKKDIKELIIDQL